MWYTINVSGAKICQLDPFKARNMNILTCAPNIFITAAPPPRRSHAPHPCRGSLASRPGGLSYGETLAPRWRAADADAPEIRITPPPTQTLTVLQFSARADKPNTLLDTAPAKEPPRGYLCCTAYPLGHRSFKGASKGLFALHQDDDDSAVANRAAGGCVSP